MCIDDLFTTQPQGQKTLTRPVRVRAHTGWLATWTPRRGLTSYRWAAVAVAVAVVARAAPAAIYANHDSEGGRADGVLCARAEDAGVRCVGSVVCAIKVAAVEFAQNFPPKNTHAAFCHCCVQMAVTTSAKRSRSLYANGLLLELRLVWYGACPGARQAVRG